jgi:hypothetical protein
LFRGGAARRRRERRNAFRSVFVISTRFSELGYIRLEFAIDKRQSCASKKEALSAWRGLREKKLQTGAQKSSVVVRMNWRGSTIR